MWDFMSNYFLIGTNNLLVSPLIAWQLFKARK